MGQEAFLGTVDHTTIEKNDHRKILLLVRLLVLREAAERYCWKHQARAVLLRLECAGESPGNLVKIQTNSVPLGWGGAGLNTSNNLPSNAKATGPHSTLLGASVIVLAHDCTFKSAGEL